MSVLKKFFRLILNISKNYPTKVSEWANWCEMQCFDKFLHSIGSNLKPRHSKTLTDYSNLILTKFKWKNNIDGQNLTNRSNSMWLKKPLHNKSLDKMKLDFDFLIFLKHTQKLTFWRETSFDHFKTIDFFCLPTVFSQMISLEYQISQKFFY